MTKKLIWRLRESPTSKSLMELIESKLLTKEEAREILFSSETKDERDSKSLKSEIKFLRELVEKLSDGNNTRVIKIIKDYNYPYSWYKPYYTWQGSATCDNITFTSSGAEAITTNSTSFKDIKTF